MLLSMREKYLSKQQSWAWRLTSAVGRVLIPHPGHGIEGVLLQRIGAEGWIALCIYLGSLPLLWTIQAQAEDARGTSPELPAPAGSTPRLR